MIWGPGEHDWNPMLCEPLATPDQIPPANLTTPLWPKDFTVDEYATLTFPGRDPCKIDFKNSTYTLEFNTDPDGPTYHTIGELPALPVANQHTVCSQQATLAPADRHHSLASRGRSQMAISTTLSTSSGTQAFASA